MQENNLKVQKQDRRIIRTKNAIELAFLQLMKQKCISKITVKELCDLANINRKTFYTYYDKVSDVLTKIESEIVSEFENSIHDLKNKTPEITVTDIFIIIKDLLDKHSKFVHQLVQIDNLAGLENKMKIILKKAIQGTLPKVHLYNVDILNISMEYIITGAVSMYIEWFCSDNQISFEMLSRLSIEFVNSNIETALKYSSQ